MHSTIEHRWNEWRELQRFNQIHEENSVFPLAYFFSLGIAYEKGWNLSTYPGTLSCNMVPQNLCVESNHFLWVVNRPACHIFATSNRICSKKVPRKFIGRRKHDQKLILFKSHTHTIYWHLSNVQYFCFAWKTRKRITSQDGRLRVFRYATMKMATSMNRGGSWRRWGSKLNHSKCVLLCCIY